MGIIFIISTRIALIGIVHTGQLIWTRLHKRTLLATYKADTPAHKATLRFLTTRRLTVIGSLLSFVNLAFVVHLIVHHFVRTTLSPLVETI